MHYIFFVKIQWTVSPLVPEMSSQRVSCRLSKAKQGTFFAEVYIVVWLVRSIFPFHWVSFAQPAIKM